MIIFSLFIILATLTTNVACNLAAASVVFSSLFGKVLTYKKAVVVAMILSICFLPWKLVENPESYVYTLNGTLAVFLGPITGICLAALWSQYRNRLRLPDLYYQDGGAYYFGRLERAGPGDHGSPVHFHFRVPVYPRPQVDLRQLLPAGLCVRLRDLQRPVQAPGPLNTLVSASDI